MSSYLRITYDGYTGFTGPEQHTIYLSKFNDE